MYDLITIGRSSLDLYALQTGAFTDIKSFAAYVGGSPTNIAVGAQRLGLKVALLTALGADQVGGFVRAFLESEGVDTQFIPTLHGKRTSAVVLGIEPPDKFPLVFYRDNCADIEIGIDDVLRLPLAHTKFLEICGTALSKEPSRSATFTAAELARQAGSRVVMDIDFRADQWHDPRAFGVTVRSILRLVNIAIGTEEEINAACLKDLSSLEIKDQQISAPTVRGDLTANIAVLLSLGLEALVVKRGSDGASVHFADGSSVVVAGFPVQVLNVLGAGDAFAAGLMYGLVQGWDWQAALRLGNGCGAMIVTKHGCCAFAPTLAEVTAFMDGR